MGNYQKLSVAAGDALSTELGELIEEARSFASSSRSENTRRAYAGDLRRFATWANRMGIEAMPAEPSSVALYATELAKSGRKWMTISRAMSAIAQAHRIQGHASPLIDPVVSEVLAGIRRVKGTAQKQAPAILPDELRRMSNALPESLRGLRDRALLVVGFAGGFRRSELNGLCVSHLTWDADGVLLYLPRSKADQEGAGATVGLPFGSDPRTCPVRTLQRWIEAAGLDDGPVFRAITNAGVVRDVSMGTDSIRNAVRRAAKKAGSSESISAHSLRVGLATTAVRAGKSEAAVLKHARWKSRRSLDRYCRDVDILEGDRNPAAGVGL